MLTLNPSTDAERYAVLRADFLRFGCGRHLEEQRAVPREDAHRSAGKGNLICTLSGRYPIPIIVAALYPVRVSSEGGNGWPEAVLLPILYQALQAQPRTFTYVFAALSGADGERVFLEQLHEHRTPPPVAFVALDALGAGLPLFAEAGSRSDRQVRQILEGEAWRIAGLQGYGSTPDYVKSNKEFNRSALANGLTEPLKQTPGVLVHGEQGTSVTQQDFHKDFEFLAYYLCALDVKLDPLAGTPD